MTMYKSGCFAVLADQLFVIPNGDANAVEVFLIFMLFYCTLKA